jgi:Replication factor-A protein 1, N-terminal domain
MSLTTDFIPNLPSKEKGRIYATSDSVYVVPRLQILAIHENPDATALKKSLDQVLQGIPASQGRGLKFMTVSDGIHSISAALSLDLNPLVDNGTLRENSIIDLDAWVIDDDEDSPDKNKLLLCLGYLRVFISEFPEKIGNPKDIFEVAPTKKVESNYTHPLLNLTPHAIDAIESGTGGNVYTAAKPLSLQVNSIVKNNPDLWDFKVFDGLKTFGAVMKTSVDLDKLGVEKKFENNVKEIMKELKDGDIISVPQYLILAAGDAKKMVVYNCSILHHA